jgi:hypothetical protein
LSAIYKHQHDKILSQQRIFGSEKDYKKDASIVKNQERKWNLGNEVRLAISAMMQSTTLSDIHCACPQQKQGYANHNKIMQPELYASGTIASLKNDENGNPTWIVSGLWEGSLAADNKTQGKVWIWFHSSYELPLLGIRCSST